MIDMDRIDDLLIKARAEMIGKAPKRNVVTKDVAFNMAWDMVKGYEDQDAVPYNKSATIPVSLGE